MRIMIPALFATLALFATWHVSADAPEQRTVVAAAGAKTDLIFIGTYTNKAGSKGIYRSEFDPTTGKLSAPVLAIESSNPSFLAIHPSGKSLYCVNEDGNFEGKKSGAVTAFSLDKVTGALKLLNQKPSEGPAPCHVTVDPSGKNLAVANYNGGGSEKGPLTNNFTVFPIAADGSLGTGYGQQFGGKSVNPARQKETHPHSVHFTPDGQFLMLADLGTDKVTVFPFNKDVWSTIQTQLKLAPGAGPRHLDMDANGKKIYVVNELNSTVTVFEWLPEKELQTITTLPEKADAKKNGCAEIRVHRELGYVYASNRGHDSIAIFKIGADGLLTAVGHQQHPQLKTPRGFTLHGNYLIAAGQSTNKIIVFRIDPATGQLKATDDVVDVPAPVCIKVLKRT